jgi:hypothetical protein
MDEVIEECITLIKDHTKDKEKRMIMADAVFKGVSSKKIPVAKLKELPELIACRHIGLQWNANSVHGHDGKNSLGQKVELKTAITSSKNININYAVKDTPQRTLAHYASSSFAGGHYWVGMDSRKLKVLWFVHISQARFLGLLQEHSLHVNINFGSTICKKCKRCKRIDRLAGLKECSH